MSDKPTITVSITGGTADEVAQAVMALAARMGGEKVQAVRVDETAPAAEVDLTSDNATPAKPKPAPTKQEAPAPEEPEGVVKDLTPAEAREMGIKEIQAHFAANPGSINQITDMQKKYSVKMFTEITDAKALDFLADVRLITSGAPAS